MKEVLLMSRELTSKEVRARRAEINGRISEAEVALEKVRGELRTFQNEECPHRDTYHGGSYYSTWIGCNDCGKSDVTSQHGVPRLKSV